MSAITKKGVFASFPLRTIQNCKGYHWFVVGTVCVGAFMAALDASIINIVLPVLKKEFHVRMHIIEWVSLIYLLTLAALIVPFGRMADLFGRRWMYTIGFTVFIIGSALCGFSNTLRFLLISRILQAVGAAMLQANSVSIVTSATPPKNRGKAIGIQASAQGIGLSLGPTIGGMLVSFFGWRWVFLVNLPIGLIGSLLALLILPRDVKVGKRAGFDYFGALFLAALLVSLIYFLNMGFKEGWTSITVVLSYIIFGIGLILFLFTETRTADPLVDLSLFKNAAFSFGNITGILSFAVMYAVLLLVPFYLDNVQRMSPLHSGLFLTIVPLGMTFFTPFAGSISDRYGSRLPEAAGMAAAAFGCLMLSMLGIHLSSRLLIAGLFLTGVGIGLFTPPNNSCVMGSTPANSLGVAGGILNMSRTLGMGLGITLGGLCYQCFLAVSGEMEEYAAPSANMVFAFKWSFVSISILSIVTLVISTIHQNKRKKSATS